MSTGNSLFRWRRSNTPSVSSDQLPPLYPNETIGYRPETPVPVTGSSAEALCSIFGDEEVSDIILQGYDGGNVVAVKALLASRSLMFRQMFFGEARSDFVPSEPGEKEVFVFDEWDCRVLHLVVEYCYTDTCSAMKCQPTEDIARMMASLRVASKAFKLPGLLQKINQWIWRQVSRYPALACAIIDEGIRNDDVDDVSLQTLQLKTRAALLPGQRAVGSGVLALSKPGLLFVLRTLNETTSHYLLLQVIEQWVDFSSEDSFGANSSRERASREAFARKCAMRFIKVSKIPQENLETVMKRSNLFTANNLISSIIARHDNPDSKPSNIEKPKRNMTIDRQKLTSPSAKSTTMLVSSPRSSMSPNNFNRRASFNPEWSLGPLNTDSNLSIQQSMESQ